MVVIFWFRRDLRLEDNAGLHHALHSGWPVIPIFIFDREILDQLDDKYDRRVDYIDQALAHLNATLSSRKTSIQIYYGYILDVFNEIINKYDVKAVYTNRDYEPSAIKRDMKVKDHLVKRGINFYDFKDQVIFEKSEIVKPEGKPYTVFTAYANKWKATIESSHLQTYDIPFDRFYSIPSGNKLPLLSMGFKRTDVKFAIPVLNEKKIFEYDKYRDFPSVEGTTQIGMALRFGTVSVRQCVVIAKQYNQTWLSQLIWREFFMQIMYHFPHVVHQSFKKVYDQIPWRNVESEFERWCSGQTGYPLVDAGMVQLNETGYMHNRVRMITASFLCKHLLIDWRWGEAYFAKKLNDYDLSANNGNWQWVAGSGCDAAPYFRIFSPDAQTKKFDKDLKYIKTWLPSFKSDAYIPPMVEHDMARHRALDVYKTIHQDPSVF